MYVKIKKKNGKKNPKKTSRNTNGRINTDMYAPCVRPKNNARQCFRCVYFVASATAQVHVYLTQSAATVATEPTTNFIIIRKFRCEENARLA